MNTFYNHNIPAPSHRNKYRHWVTNIVVAAVVTFLIYMVSVYISHGTFIRPFDYKIGIELFFTFCYFLLLFLFYPKISRLIHSPAFQRLNSVSINLLEGFIVVLVTAFLTAIIKLFPLWFIILFIEDVQMIPDAVRRNFVIHAVSGLFFYYFIERNRIRKRLQQERLNAARLEREKFHAELQKLKNQVNPHFLFDSLEALTPLIKKDAEESVKLVEKLSEVYRSFLASNEKELITLKEELETIDAYIYLLRKHAGDTIEIQKNSLNNAGDLSLPPGVLFFVIEQMIKRKETNAEEIFIIKIKAENKMLRISCDDLFLNGNALDEENEFEQISNRYSFFSDLKPEVFSDENQTLVHLPLLKIENNESSNY